LVRIYRDDKSYYGRDDGLVRPAGAVEADTSGDDYAGLAQDDESRATDGMSAPGAGGVGRHDDGNRVGIAIFSVFMGLPTNGIGAPGIRESYISRYGRCALSLRTAGSAQSPSWFRA
jgi:hypothetical protein